MKITKIKIENFRSFKDEIEIGFNDLNVFVGKNDIGKSTILEALDIFFNENNGTIKMDKDDINKQAENDGNDEIKISVVFSNFPEELTIDTTNPTRLSDEYLLNSEGCLEIIKKYPKAGKEKVFIKSNHPTNDSCSDLLLKKITDLKKILTSENIDCTDKTKSAVIRNSIWQHYIDDLQLNEIEIDVTKEDAKNIWEQLKKYMPLYSLFQSDRDNSDGDSEVQDPMKLAVKEILKDGDLTDRLNNVANEIKTKLDEVANNTLEKLNEMNPDIANSLTPVIPNSDKLKWADVFKNVSITGDDDIPINKRGSGVKRLILLNFFRAEAERRREEDGAPSVIYAIEEPETSQHQEHQRKLIEAFMELSDTDNTQILLTTHSPSVVKLLDFEHLQLVKGEGNREIVDVERGTLCYPSLNEVNYLAFGESDEEYHNELYGYIESERLLSDFRNGKTTMIYIRLNRDGTTTSEQKILSEYIRHQIHHPENAHNVRFVHEQLQTSINEMREFIEVNTGN
ncbi:MAG: ATP-binding protein [Bacteroidales bacterium]|nr:ATP-binding protein [Bacteroidales bacterium]